MDITGNGLRTTITGLRWETNYVFSISAVRSGIGGEGPRGPQSDVATTTCACKILLLILSLLILLALGMVALPFITDLSWEQGLS